MLEFTKSQKRHYRHLIGLGYERELSKHLAKLQKSFVLWNEGKIDPFELTERIHKFHQGPARRLHNDFAITPAHSLHFAVAGLVANEVLQLEEIEPQHRDLIAKVLKVLGYSDEEDADNEEPDEEDQQDLGEEDDEEPRKGDEGKSKT